MEKGEEKMKSMDKHFNKIIKINMPKPVVLIILCFILLSFYAMPSMAQEKEKVKEKAKLQQFLDEDGDGFNDLLPDHDGDGIPDQIDPDFKGHSAESLYMYRYMHGQTIEAERNRFQNQNRHGEPGQYGPNDSTGHGQGDGRGGHQGSNDSGNEGGEVDRGGGQGVNEGGSGHQGGGGGLNSTGPGGNKPEHGVNPDRKTNDQTPAKQDTRQGKSTDDQNRRPENGKGSSNRGGNGGQ